MDWFTFRSRPYLQTQAPRSAEEGGRTWRGDEGEDAEAGGGEEVFRLEDALDLIFDTRDHLHNRNDRYLSTVIELCKIYSWVTANVSGKREQ